MRINESKVEESKDISIKNDSEERAFKHGQYSDRLESLLEFLEQTEKVGGEQQTGSISSSTCSHFRSTRNGLSDKTNCGVPISSTRQCKKDRKKYIINQDSEELQNLCSVDGISTSSFEETIPSLPKSRERPSSKYSIKNLTQRNTKKYIWDCWEETIDGGMVFIRDSDDGDEKTDVDEATMSTGDIRSEQKTGECNNIKVLRAVGEEIHARASEMKAELDAKASKVEKLHSDRVQSEAEHVTKMKVLKKAWKKRLENLNADHDKVVADQAKLQEKLKHACESLQKKELMLKNDIESISKSEKESCERLKQEGMKDVDDAKKKWQQAENDEIKKKEQKMSPKMKRDAAKVVEPKIRQLMEQHREEIGRLQREATRELNTYKLELFKRSNEQFKREAEKIRDVEKKRLEKLEHEWMMKMQDVRREHDIETKKVCRDHEQRMAIKKKEFRAEKQKCIDLFEADVEDAKNTLEMEMEQIRMIHERDMTKMENEHSERIVEKQKNCKEDFEQWMRKRETELLHEETNNLKKEQDKMEQKIQRDIALVERKLREEESERQRQIEIEMSAEMGATTRALALIENEVKQAEMLYDAFARKEQEETSLLEESQVKLNALKETIQTREAQLAIQKSRYLILVKECDEEVSKVQQDGERRVAQSRNQIFAQEKELDELIASFPSRLNERRGELDKLKLRNSEEIRMAETKVCAMLENKKCLVEEASAKLLLLRNETSEVCKQLDEARTRKFLSRHI